jgi:hypothetical protein
MNGTQRNFGRLQLPAAGTVVTVRDLIVKDPSSSIPYLSPTGSQPTLSVLQVLYFIPTVSKTASFCDYRHSKTYGSCTVGANFPSSPLTQYFK